MKMKRLRQNAMCMMASLLICFSAVAQTPVKGVLRSQTGAPLSGATVHIKGTTTSAVSNQNGEFSINAAPGSTVVISYVGYQTQEITISNQTTLNLTLQTASTQDLSEVVVVGYGTQRRRDLTGSIATISSENFQKGQITTPEQLIAGKVPGVSIISSGGQPGAGATIRIRGGSSLRASNDPLIVIDGVPVETGGISGASNPLSFVNPNDIETFTVLKDASAAAIYGTRAANGVILITTKKGTGGKLKVGFTTTQSVSRLVKKVDVLSAAQFHQIVNEEGTAEQKAMLGAANTDWQNEIYQNAFATDNNISLSGGIKKLPYRFSLGYTNQGGILRTDKLERFSSAISVNPSFFDNHLKVNLNVKGSVQNTRFANTGAIGGAVSFNPTQPVYAVKSPERFGGFFEWLDTGDVRGLRNLVARNPLGLLMQREDRSNPRRLIGNIQADYKFHFLPDLRANINFGYDWADGKGTIYVSDSAASDYVVGGKGGQNNQYRRKRQNTVFDFYLNYLKDVASIRSRIDFTAGYSYSNFLTTVYNFAAYTAQGVKYPNTDPAFPFDKPENTLLSYFSRLNYTFNEKYLLTATIRRDGSSRFSSENRWGWFPSLALAWRMKEEPFLNQSRTVSDLKLRLGYGITGQQEGINNYDFLSFYALSAPSATYQFGDAYAQMYRPGAFNPNIKWEETATTNLAVDFGFLDNRISGSIDFYYKKTKDLLNQIPQPAGTNFSAFFIANVGSMENKGVEFSINTQPISKPNLSWDAGFNITYNKNKITNLTVVPDDPTYRGIQTGGISGGIGGGFAQVHQVGYSRNTFNLYQQVYGLDGKPQENVFVDVNADGIINQDDLTKSKSAVPDVFMGFSTNLTYKKWNAGFVLRSSLGNYVYNNVYSNTGNLLQILGSAVIYNTSVNYLETRFAGNSNNLLSDYFIRNASFLRMDNLNIGYNFGKLRGVGNLRLNAGIQNVFVITKYKGLDPEISSGIDNSLYPRPRIFSLGASLDF